MGIGNTTGEMPVEGRSSRDGGPAEYVPVSLAFPVDLASSSTRIVLGAASIALGIPTTSTTLIRTGGSLVYDGGISLGRSIDKFIAYLYGGPLALLDPNMAFAVPCMDIDWKTNLDKWNVGTHGRYGHAFTPFTLLAMTMPVLPGEKEQRKENCPRAITAAKKEDPPCSDN